MMNFSQFNKNVRFVFMIFIHGYPLQTSDTALTLKCNILKSFFFSIELSTIESFEVLVDIIYETFNIFFIIIKFLLRNNWMQNKFLLRKLCCIFGQKCSINLFEHCWKISSARGFSQNLILILISKLCEILCEIILNYNEP